MRSLLERGNLQLRGEWRKGKGVELRRGFLRPGKRANGPRVWGVSVYFSLKQSGSGGEL